jgi:hypothetical protein
MQEASKFDRCGQAALWILVITSWLWFLAYLPHFTNVSVGLWCFLTLAVTCPMVALIWLIATGMTICTSAVKRSSLVRWLVGTAPIFLGAILATTDFGLAARTRLSEPWLNHCVARAKAGADVRDPRVIGLFQVEQVVACHGGVFFFTSEYGFLDSAGVAFVPDGWEAEYSRCRPMKRLYGNWWTFRWHF